MTTLTIPVSPGELIDRITILEIKRERIEDPDKLENVRIALEPLAKVWAREIPASDTIGRLRHELKAVNESLWEIEDAIRDCERDRDFGDAFIELARSVYRTNDRRAALKREIDERLGSRLTDEKSYADYDQPE